jgi:hypothetical protein
MLDGISWESSPSSKSGTAADNSLSIRMQKARAAKLIAMPWIGDRRAGGYGVARRR